MTAAFQNTRFKIEPSGIDRRAVGGRAELSAGRINGGGLVGKIATKRRGTTVVPRTTLVPIEDKQEMTAEFSAVILQFENGELSVPGKCGKDAVKKWKAARSLPSFWTMCNLARSNPTIRDWVMARIGVNPDFNSPQFMTMAAAAMYQLMHQDNPDGEAVREYMNKKHGRRGQ